MNGSALGPCIPTLRRIHFGQITVVGLYGQGDFTSLVEGESLSRQRLCEEIARYDLLVPFNGTLV